MNLLSQYKYKNVSTYILKYANNKVSYKYFSFIAPEFKKILLSEKMQKYYNYFYE
jgi:predicted nucleotidyltransferase